MLLQRRWIAGLIFALTARALAIGIAHGGDDRSSVKVADRRNCNYEAEIAKRQKHTLRFTYHLFAYEGNALQFSTITDGIEKIDSPASKILTGDADALIDMDGDGDLDILGCNSEAVPRATWHEIRLDECKLPVRHVIEQPILESEIYGLGGLTPVDLDLDGRKDIVGVGSEHLIVLFNNGKTERWDVTLISQVAKPRAVRVRDVDGDGDQDVIFAGVMQSRAGSTRGLMWVENSDGQGKQWSSARPIFAETDRIPAISAADFDGDGDVDVALFESQLNRLLLFTNETRGTNWKEHVARDWEGTSTAKAQHPNQLKSADLDGDGTNELITTHRNNAVYCWKYQSGASGLQAEKLFNLHPSGGSGPAAAQIVVADFDANGRQELLISLARGTSSAPLYWFRYHENRWQKYEIGRGLDHPLEHVVVADYDGDGDDDIVANAISSPPFPLIWFEN